MPCLSKEMLDRQQVYILPSASNASGAWKAIVDKLQRFRQDRQWPDSAEIKRIKALPKQDEKPSKRKYELLKAPLGLPIVFHFPKDGKDADLTLQGNEEGHERLSSPLILRPLACQGERYLGLVVLLENYAPYVEKVKVMQKAGTELREKPAIIETNLAVAKRGDISLLKGKKDVLRAFMAFLWSNRF